MYWLKQLFCSHPPKRLMILHIAQKLLCPKCGKEWNLSAEVCVLHDVGLVMYDRQHETRRQRAAREFGRIHQVK